MRTDNRQRKASMRGEPSVVGTAMYYFLRADGIPSDAAKLGAKSHDVEMIKALSYGLTTGDTEALAQAELAAEVLLATPQKSAFYSSIRPDTQQGALRTKFAVAQSHPSTGLAGEGRSIKIGTMDFGQTALEPQKIAGTAVITLELLRHSVSINALERALRESIEASTDLVFVDQLQIGITSIPASGHGPAAVHKDLRQALGTIPSGPDSRFWVGMGVDLCKRLSMATNSLGELAYPNLGPNGGFIGSLPVAVTSALTSDIVVTDATALVTAEDAIELDRSTAATLEMDSAPSSTIKNAASPPVPVETVQVSLWQSGAVALRGIRHFAWQPVRPVHSARITGALALYGLDDSTSPPS